MTTEIAILILILVLIARIWVQPFLKETNLIILEDKLKTDLDKPLKIKTYKRLTGRKFNPYLIDTTSDYNERIFEMFSTDMDEINNMISFDNMWFDIVFVNKVYGLIEEYEDEYTLLTPDTKEYYIINRDKIDMIKDLYKNQFDQIREISLDGVIKLNKKEYFLSDLTSMNIYGTEDDRMATIIYNFGNKYEKLTFKNMDDALDSIFSKRNSDIRLIQKIANSALILTEED